MEAKKISIVVPSYNERGNVRVLYGALAEVFSSMDYRWEVIFVDDGSTDGTLDELKVLAGEHKNLFWVELARNFGHQSALLAGLSVATGDAVVSMDGDMQHPPLFLPRLIEQWEQGYEVVYTLREEDKKLSAFKRGSSKAFYRVLNLLSNIKVEPGAADFRLLDRRVVDVLLALGESDPFLRGLVKWVGFRQIGLEYLPEARFSGQSKYNFKKMINLALRGITSFSERPLHLALWVGGVFTGLALLYLPYVVWSVVTDHAMAGWASLLMTVVFFGGVQLLMLGIIGLYIGKIFVQSKGRPEYIIRDTNLQ